MQHRDLREEFDYVHPETGEVFQLDTLRLAIKESSKGEDFIGEHIGLIDSVFRALIVMATSRSARLSWRKLQDAIRRRFLKTIGGVRVYRGIRPHNPGQQENA